MADWDYIHDPKVQELGLGRVPSETQEGIIWRGLSSGEYRNLLETGNIQSRGDYNAARDAHRGVTFYSTEPRRAEMYAHDFAPSGFKATATSPAYVIGIRQPSEDKLFHDPQNIDPTGHEVAVKGDVSISDIVKLYQGSAVLPHPEGVRSFNVILDWREMPLSDLGRPPPSEPRSTAFATLAIPSEEDTSQEKSKQTGRTWRGIGSLMRRRLFPIAQVAQQAWGTLPDEQKDQVTEFLNNPIDFGLGRGEYPPGFKGGLDYFRQMLGMGPEPPEGGIASLPDLREGLDFYHGTPNVWEAEGEDYPVGRPDLTFMGTGEGQQLYAPGFYGGEERDVAWEYAEFLGTKYGKVPNLYKGKIPAEIVTNKFIDFNFPVSEQSQTVQDAFKNLGYEPKNPDRFSGADILERMKRNMGEDPAIEALRKAGVVGLRYLDQYSRQNKNLYKGKSIVKPNGEALFMNEDWQRQTRNVLKYLVDENVSVGDFILQQREDLGAKGWLSRLFSSSRQEEKFLDILEGTNVSKSPLTRNLVIWDQPLLNELGKTIKKEMAHGGFIDKPLYERTL